MNTNFNKFFKRTVIPEKGIGEEVLKEKERKVFSFDEAREEIQREIDSIINRRETNIIWKFIFGVVIAISVVFFAIVIDLYKDVSRYDKLDNIFRQNLIEQNQQIMDLNQKLIQYREEELEKNIVVECPALECPKCPEIESVLPDIHSLNK
ncbi:hypothetical protein ACFLZ0_00395 [Patescibacteria group bacterium]